MGQNEAASEPQASTPGAWTPLGVATFRHLWLAILAGNIGTWIHDVAAAWLMAERTGSAFMVAAVQAATTLPVMCFALFAGALADIVDRRRYLVLAQAWMLLVASALALLEHAQLLTPWLLVALTFALGTGAAMAMPAQQALTPDLVPRPMLSQAVALGSLGMNIARAIGPALGGLVMALSGAALAFAINAVSFLVLALVFWRWRPAAPDPQALPRESFGPALRAGLGYAARAGAFRAVLVKAGLFFLAASAFGALLPIVARQELGASAGTYGAMLGCIGAGAVVGAMLLPALRRCIGPDALVLVATLAYAACIACLALVRLAPVLFGVSLLAGLAWITVLSTFHVAAQTGVPAWVRARALSLYIVVFSGGLSAGSLGWGALAQAIGSSGALLVATASTVVAALLGLRFGLGAAIASDVAPSGHWPPPPLADEVAGERGPVLVTIEYRIDPALAGPFLAAMREVGRMRRRNGALHWTLAEDVERRGTWLEAFVDASWLEHLRQHARVTGDDRRLQESVARVLAGPPVIRHFVGGVPGTPVAALGPLARGSLQ